MLDQPFVKDGEKTVQEVLNEQIAGAWGEYENQSFLPVPNWENGGE